MKFHSPAIKDGTEFYDGSLQPFPTPADQTSLDDPPLEAKPPRSMPRNRVSKQPQEISKQRAQAWAVPQRKHRTKLPGFIARSQSKTQAQATIHTAIQTKAGRWQRFGPTILVGGN
ncbi:MAG: hypothetical protein M2R45_04488 [Verrucomicrobia subdivision 3 bacterium]|nr:hypothetical protein [Limisphaerales bacterium]MCS1412668.1 hypothetical protein [Limisphaerales bacterium]